MPSIERPSWPKRRLRPSVRFAPVGFSGGIRAITSNFDRPRPSRSMGSKYDRGRSIDRAAFFPSARLDRWMAKEAKKSE